MLYQLSYAHHEPSTTNGQSPATARLAGFEPATLGLEDRCSIRMSYRRVQREPLNKSIQELFKDTLIKGLPKRHAVKAWWLWVDSNHRP